MGPTNSAVVEKVKKPKTSRAAKIAAKLTKQVASMEENLLIAAVIAKTKEDQDAVLAVVAKLATAVDSARKLANKD